MARAPLVSQPVPRLSARLGGHSSKEVKHVSGLVILTFLVLIAPLSYFFGVDSRRSSDRGWVGAGRRS
jgi:hypothetical protein